MGIGPDELLRLCRAHRVQRLTAIGSAAGPDFDDDSDIDLVVDFAPMLAVERALAFLGLAEALERASGRHVDLIERSAIRNPWFRRELEGTERLLYNAA